MLDLLVPFGDLWLQAGLLPVPACG